MYINKLASRRDLRAAVTCALRVALSGKDFHNAERMKEIACRMGEALGLSREEMDNIPGALVYFFSYPVPVQG